MAYKNPYPLSPTVLFKKIAQQSTSRDYKHKEMVFEQGTRADAMYYLQSGNVKLVVEAKNGKKAVLAILRKGDFFGEGCLGREPLRMFSAMAIQRTTLARLRKAIIVSTIQQEPAFAKHFISHLVARIGRIEEDVVDQISAPAKNDWQGFCCYLQISDRNPNRSPFSSKSARKPSRKW
jgi:CRP/FNR family transcriptional regulator, cyclic AMP receptor protein